ncbi:streptomycin 3'-adenylyltransferase [Kribbella antiqua]|uniref:Streptomycin 3'-adenylyltransferase n=1 Tax=Kribbella antiqua TaxID=2512217 RepID=A0A4R2IVA0_9ACTN|nr:aminoglycoside adenylyltransferase domain-containing protein [Kribbella antiqua]TCO49304.1 streptomycin 3'-adenylyltransferase [Kribbella antiqua]
MTPAHPADRPQSWDDCDEDLRAYILGSLDAMGLDAVGIYLHGSLAMRCFYRAKSDVDVLVVVPETLSEAERAHAARALARRSLDRPMLGDFELSALTVAQAAQHQHPRPFEVHYSAAWTTDILTDRVDYTAQRSDPDLAAHITVVHKRGAVVSGPPPAELFAEVPHADYLAAITADLHEVLSGHTLLSTPYYGVLNACRVLATVKQGSGTILSKEEGAVWALDCLPTTHAPLIQQALTCYRSARPVTAQNRETDGHAWDEDALLRFRDAVLAQL